MPLVTVTMIFRLLTKYNHQIEKAICYNNNNIIGLLAFHNASRLLKKLLGRVDCSCHFSVCLVLVVEIIGVVKGNNSGLEDTKKVGKALLGRVSSQSIICSCTVPHIDSQIAHDRNQLVSYYLLVEFLMLCLQILCSNAEWLKIDTV